MDVQADLGLVSPNQFTLTPPSLSFRKQLQVLWDEAVRFIEANESRIRVETQIIQGEEFIVWRWLQVLKEIPGLGSIIGCFISP